jgi:hypothetical protein
VRAPDLGLSILGAAHRLALEDLFGEQRYGQATCPLDDHESTFDPAVVRATGTLSTSAARTSYGMNRDGHPGRSGNLPNVGLVRGDHRVVAANSPFDDRHIHDVVMFGPRR